MLLISKPVLCIVIIAISISNAKNLYTRSESTETDSVGRTLRKHPGCFIWWFLPGCILGDRVAVDPFGIYPWKKFCRKYSDLQKHKRCQAFVNIENKHNKEINTNLNVKIDEDKNIQETIKEGAQVTDSKNQEEVSIQVLINNGKEHEYQLTKLIKDLEKVDQLKTDEKHKNEIADTGKIKPISVSLQRPKRRVRYNSNLPLEAFSHTQIRLGRSQNMNHHARNSLPQPLVNGWAGRVYKSAKELHPGCDKYWFLPGCPLGNILGVDPFRQYPWERLCQYKTLQNQPTCYEYMKTSSDKYLSERIPSHSTNVYPQRGFVGDISFDYQTSDLRSPIKDSIKQIDHELHKNPIHAKDKINNFVGDDQTPLSEQIQTEKAVGTKN